MATPVGFPPVSFPRLFTRCDECKRPCFILHGTLSAQLDPSLSTGTPDIDRSLAHPACCSGGTRGGQGDFKWSDVAADKDREYYLGHSLRAPVGRWQNGKDLTWYNKEGGADAEARERERQEELKRIKEAEEDALAQALGFAPTPRQPTVPATPSVSTSTSTDPNAAILEKARRKAEKRAEHEARKAERQRVREERAARHKHSRDEREGSPGRHGDEPITTAATSGTTTADPQGHATTIAILSYDRATIAQMHPGSSGEFAAAAPTGTTTQISMAVEGTETMSGATSAIGRGSRRSGASARVDRALDRCVETENA
ncbi:hypothetical protein C6P46_006656 [Rhodotorula mucilaginosa]|uniref:Multiple myeloma tumor-associated protein 2-like N-terminal domain-containing protein n=1 Tax=Rhodotorula mucilaginosa TaxID=5537 RepID=A0A9P6VYD5_RHOMI|nr:hypothetical protein C6P46_006656 [Rhodotorula mucilaginosa]